MSIQWWNGVMNVVTNIDYLAIPVAFVVLRDLREPDVPPRVLVSRVLFVVLCGAHHGVMAFVLFTGSPVWFLRTVVNATMAGVSCWSVLEHVRWARVKGPPVSVAQHQLLEERVRERTRDLDAVVRELRQTQEELVRNERLAVLGQLSSGLGHELRNPLSVMLNAVYYLDKISTTADPRVERYHRILREQVDLSQRIVENLLDFARVKVPSPTTFAIQELLDEQVARIETTGIHLTIAGDPTVVVWADRFQVGQAFFNILTNATQALESVQRKTLLLHITQRDDVAIVTIRDSGVGIDGEAIRRIFEPLYSTKTRGIGLGLAITRAYLRANHGSIDVSSVPGETEFAITLPTVEVGAALAGDSVA